MNPRIFSKSEVRNHHSLVWGRRGTQRNHTAEEGVENSSDSKQLDFTGKLPARLV